MTRRGRTITAFFFVIACGAVLAACSGGSAADAGPDLPPNPDGCPTSLPSMTGGIDRCTDAVQCVYLGYHCRCDAPETIPRQGGFWYCLPDECLPSKKTGDACSRTGLSCVYGFEAPTCVCDDQNKFLCVGGGPDMAVPRDLAGPVDMGAGDDAGSDDAAVPDDM